ncbi:MAG: glycosyl hydrolase [Candidatus Woesebacteria bacterium]
MVDANFLSTAVVAGVTAVMIPFNAVSHTFSEFSHRYLHTADSNVSAQPTPTPEAIEALMNPSDPTQPTVLGMSMAAVPTATPYVRRTHNKNPKPWPRSTATPTPSPTPTPLPSLAPTPTVTATPKPTANPSQPDFSGMAKQWGAYTGYEPSDVTTFEALAGKPMNIVATFVHWGNEKDFPVDYAPVARDKDKTLLIFWEAKDYNVDSNVQPSFNFDSVIAGKWDSYFTQFAKDAKAYKGNVILIPFDEMNGNWSPWSGTLNGNTPEKYIAAYRHARGYFKDVPNVKFGWAVNNDSVPDSGTNKFENYYPGDEYVDYVGVDGFNFNDGEWENWSNVFDDSITRLEKYPKPIYIFSTASAPGTNKAQWIQDGFGAQIKKHKNVVGWIWFNENKEKDWRINSDSASLNAFKQVISGL